MLCSPVVKGYCFKTKKWGEFRYYSETKHNLNLLTFSSAKFYIDGVEDITWNETAFEKIVLSHDYKTVVWAFVDAQLSRDRNSFDDIIEGKGKHQVRKESSP